MIVTKKERKRASHLKPKKQRAKDKLDMIINNLKPSENIIIVCDKERNRTDVLVGTDEAFEELDRELKLKRI